MPKVLRLPAVVHLSITGDEGPPTAVAEEREALKFFSPRRAKPPEPFSRTAVARELAAWLSVEEERSRDLATRGVLRRVIARSALRGSEPLSVKASAASALHARIHRAGTKGASSPRKPFRLEGRPRLRQDEKLRDAWQPNVHTAPAARQRRRTRRTWPFGEPRRVLRGEPVRIGLSALALGGAVLVLASLSNLPFIAQHVETAAGRGTSALTKGVRALLTADTRAGTRDFRDALAQYREAIRHLQESTTLLQRTVARLDPASRFSTAQTLLAVGENAAALGAEAAEVVERFQGGSASLTETLEGALPSFSRLAEGLADILKKLDAVDRTALPDEATETVAVLQQNLFVLQRGIEAFLKSHAVVLELLGSRHDRQYLVMFQNNRELRPTGGFIGSFALVDVSRGEVRKVHVDTIYNPDGQLKDFLVPPAPLQKITDRWFTRDANWFADFRTSAQKVAHLFERSAGPTVDGVLAVTPTLLEDLLRFTGPIPMPDYGVTVTAENVTAETQRLVTYEYDRERNEPKAFIADLVPEVLSRMTTLPRERWGELTGTLLEALAKKHLLVYLRSEEAETAVVQLGWGGTLPVLPSPSAKGAVLADHLGRIEANIGGHKTDDLIEQSVEHEVTAASHGSVDVTLVVTRHHRGSPTGTPGANPAEDPTRKPNIVYERTFVPLESELLEARGFTKALDVPTAYANTAEVEQFLTDNDVVALEQAQRVHESGMTVGSESGFTTFGGWVVTNSEETTVTVLRYRLPSRLPRASLLASVLRYELLLTHQPGHLPVLTRSSLRVPEGFRISWAGPSSAVTKAGEQKVTYAMNVDRDRTWGAVLEEK